jgi:hypothetical protein
MDQSHAYRPSVVIDALDDVSVQLELGDDGGREVNPGGVQLGKSDRLVTGLAQSLQQPPLLGVKENHQSDSRPPARVAALRPVAGRRSPVAGRRWPVAGGRWPAAGGWWPAAALSGPTAFNCRPERPSPPRSAVWC